MPEDSKKSPKGKHDAKEQRKPRRSRHLNPPEEKKSDRKPEESKVSVSSKPIVPPTKPPVYEEPGPAFYANLKRETNEILKITEEANAKYKKKEIQSNWSKYAVPINTYEEMEVQENMGMDYDKLIAASLSIGGHFQFKHEKSWDTTAAPSLYDKYFDINMDNLALALNTVPFHERNNIKTDIFTDSDLMNMKNRSVRYKAKYYNDKNYTTPELECEDKILNALSEGLSESSNVETEDGTKDVVGKKRMNSESICFKSEDILHEISEVNRKHSSDTPGSDNNSSQNPNVDFQKQIEINIENTNLNTTENILLNKPVEQVEESSDTELNQNKEIDDIIEHVEKASKPVKEKDVIVTKKEPVMEQKAGKVAEEPKSEPKKPVIESPEDLEKWLDDFLDN